MAGESADIKGASFDHLRLMGHQPDTLKRLLKTPEGALHLQEEKRAAPVVGGGCR